MSTDFAWLPEDVAEAFCALALHQDQTRPYGSFHEVQLGFNENYQAWLHMEGLYYLGETRSVEEFKIFSQMPAERRCLGCGVQSDERFGLLPPQDRGKLFAATLRLMRLVLADELMDVTDDEEQISGHFTRLSITETDISLLPFQRCCCPYSRARRIAQLVAYLGLVKPNSCSNYSRADHCRSFPEDHDPH